MQIQNNAQRGPAAPSSVPGSNVRTPSYLGPALEIKGEISGDEDLRLDCKVEGLVSIGGFRLTVGPSAHVTAEIVAREAVISGEVTGDVRASDRIEIKKNASVVGDISTGKIMIEEGAYFKGTVEIDSKGQQIGTDLNSLLSGAKASD
ncbi:MAG: polymer-forming cytoskeletal protein [Acidobacteriia bacterium]|nr:polymer-forming cytoskeletal protein [Terriglobia bacterium]